VNGHLHLLIVLHYQLDVVQAHGLPAFNRPHHWAVLLSEGLVEHVPDPHAHGLCHLNAGQAGGRLVELDNLPLIVHGEGGKGHGPYNHLIV